jgi:hypothetical protein
MNNTLKQNNKYSTIYQDLIERAKNRVIEGYTEKHHILPRCMNGDNSKENIAKLTAREHFIAHRLLTKMYPENRKLQYALYAMCRQHRFGRTYKVSASLYERLRLIRNQQIHKRTCKFCTKEYFAKGYTSRVCDKCKEPRECKCGCKGSVMTPGHFYKPNHHDRGGVTYKCVCKFCNKEYMAGSSTGKCCQTCLLPRLCECGCGELIKLPGRKIRSKRCKNRIFRLNNPI